MPVTEICTPYTPLREDLSAPVVYLTGMSGPEDPWYKNAVNELQRAARPGKKLYVANSGQPAFESDPADILKWQATYIDRAADNGSAIIWRSVASAKSKKTPEISQLFERAANGELLAVCGIAQQLQSRDFRRLEAEATEAGLRVVRSVHAACDTALDLLRAA